MTEGVVFNVQRYSVQDGPGIRTTVFLKGCPLRCAWCHNPEGLSASPETMTVESRCIRCGACLRACTHAQDDNAGRLPSQMDQCDLCGACVEACPTGAREIVGTRMSVDALLAAVLRDRVFYEDSGGGVTFSGGEPLAQPGFLGEALTVCRANGLHTAVDTCGFAPQADLLAVAKLTDLFLYDLKFMDESAHVKFTGQSNSIILDNLRALSALHKAIWVRIPLIPGLNDSPGHLQTLATFAASLPGVCQVNLLPFHANGAQKAERLGQPVRLTGVEPPAAQAMAAALAVFRRAGLPAYGGG
jgi:pyruvate formate lyase activating enzyme